MQTEIIIAGFGGQGVLFAGQLLAYAGMGKGLGVTWIPSYGPEMRGGTANCTVIISDEEIGSPMVRYPQAVLVVNSSIIERAVTRTDIKVVMVPGNVIAEQLGDRRMTNMVMLGALLANLPVIPLEALEKALQEHLPARHQHLLPLNSQAIRKGAEYLAERVG
jgi:2-oxoglutarate ferredoxin oxidoreductase subunit gamma